MDEQTKAQIRAAKAEGAMEGVVHVLDVVRILVVSPDLREKIDTCGAELVDMYKRDHARAVAHFVDVSRARIPAPPIALSFPCRSK